MVRAAGIQPYCLWVVPLHVRSAKLGGVSSCHAQPVLLSCRHVCALVDAEPERQLVLPNSGRPKEPQIEADQLPIAVDEDDATGLTVRLALCALAPVGSPPDRLLPTAEPEQAMLVRCRVSSRLAFPVAFADHDDIARMWQRGRRISRPAKVTPII